MVKTVSKSTLGKQKHEDRHAAGKTSFEPINIEAKTPRTVVLLLASEEEQILLQALSSLDKFAVKSEQNVQVLYNTNIFNMLVPLLTHPQLYIKRFAIKLLSEMCFCVEVRTMLLKEKHYVKDFLQYLRANEDLVLKEFSASIVAELTKLPEGYVQLVESGMVDVLLPNLLCTDPDVQHNCLQIMYNLLKDPCSKDLLVHSHGFQFPPLLDVLASEYPAIQNLSLDVLTCLTEWSTDNFLQEKFLGCGGILKLFDIIEDIEMKDIHGKCLNVLDNVCSNPTVLNTLQSSGTNRLLKYVDNIQDIELRPKALCVLARLAATRKGQKILIENEIVDQVVPIILEETIGMTAAVCRILIQIIKDVTALRQVVQMDTVDILFTVIKQESRGWDSRGAAILLLCEILQRDYNSCIKVVADQKHQILVNLLLDDEISVNIATNIANCLACLASTDEIRNEIVEPDLVKALLYCFKDRPEDTIPLRVAACEAINALLCNGKIRKWLHMKAGLETIWESLTKPSTTLPLLQVTANLIYFAVLADKTLASDLYKLGAFNWLYGNKSLRNECPAWETATEALLNNFLPLKFAYTGKLDLTDVIDSTFYMTRVPISSDKVLKGKFPNLKELLDCGASPCVIVYVVQFETVINKSSVASVTGVSRERYSSVSGVTRESKKRLSVGLREKLSTSKSSTNDNIVSDTSEVLQDAYLREYLERLKEEIKKLNIDHSLLNNKVVSKEPSVVDGNTVLAMSTVIAKFVCDQLCGSVATEPCTAHILELHLTELKLELETCLIPLGCLRVGLYLERALLFKVLADQVGLPCSLVRGQYGRSWVEVAVPDIPPPPRPVYPSKLLRPNFIVDLMHDPGRMIALNSHEAQDYCKN